MEVASYEDLKSFFPYDPVVAIEYCKNIICAASNFEDFQEFLDYHSQNSHISTCQNEWTNRMSIHCNDCATDINSCVCLECFLNGNHQGHDYQISINSSGNCDCGDTSFWKTSGFCAKHHGLEQDSHPENYLDEKLRTALTDTVFKASFNSIRKLEDDDTESLSEILDFLKLFLQFGDGFRRLIAISLTEKVNLEKFMTHLFDCSYEFNQQIQSFFGLLISDELFKTKFALVNYKLMITTVIPLSIDAVRGKNVNSYQNTKPWDQFWFHSYSVPLLQEFVKKHEFDWFSFIFKTLKYVKELLSFKNLRFYLSDVPNFFNYIEKLASLTASQPTDQIQNLFDSFVTEILATGTSKSINLDVVDTIVATSFDENFDDGFFNYVFSFQATFYNFLQAFKSNENLKFDKLFEELNKSFDLTPIFKFDDEVTENQRFVFRIVNLKENNLTEINEDYYKSFSNGGSFLISYPLFYSVCYLLRSDEICRVKIAEFLLLAKYQSLRIQLGIATLKNVVSMVCYTQSLVSRDNQAIMWLYYNYINNPKLVSNGIPLLFPLLQLTIGLKCNQNDGIHEFSFKEFFAFEMAREIGIFDDFESNDVGKEKQMTFSFLYLALLLVIERTLFNFDGIKFVREQIIFELKHGVSDLNLLSKLHDIKVNEKISPPILMNEIIHDVAVARQNDSGDVSFHLKDGIDVNFISAINYFNREKVLMNDQISKHPDELIKIQQFEPEETFFFHQKSDELNIQLKEFLITPTVLAVIYQTLRKSCESHVNELNDHFAMNILILISKFIQDLNKEDDGSIKLDEVIKYKSTIVDLINELKRCLFNLTINERGEATIQNKFTKKTFDLFIRTKIGSSNESPKSIIEILLEKGELGKKVLNQMAIEIEKKNDDQNELNLNLMKKNRAKKMKEEIMNHFKTLSSSFSLQEDQNTTTTTQTNTSLNEVCSICSIEEKDEVLSYPLYIYRTKLPFIFDKPPLVEMTKLNSIREADVLQDKEIIESIENDDEVDEDDEKQIVDPETTFARALFQSPHLDITNDLDEEEIRNRQNMIDQLHQRIIERYERDVQEAEERKNQRKQMKLLSFQEKKEAQIRKQKELENPNELVSKRCTAGNLFVIQFGICQHLVHPSCVHKNDFMCPIDRSFKNGFLPNIEDFKDHPKLPESLNTFISKYSMFFKYSDEKIIDVFVELVKSISGLITTFEVRLRSLPDCLDSKKNKILSRNLFLTVWHAYRLKGKPTMKTGFKDDIDEEVDKKLTVFQRFIKKIVESDEIIDNNKSFLALVNQFVQSSFKCNDEKNEKEMYLFLRRVCLVEHFLLTKIEKENTDQKSNQIIDWDEILSSSNLGQKFNVSFHHLDPEFEFRPFVFSPMPKEFIRFCMPPFKFGIEDTSVCSVFNILDYNEMIAEYNDFDGDDFEMKDYSKKLVLLDEFRPKTTLIKSFSNKNYPSVFLSIGNDQSAVRVVDGKKSCLLRTFYVDKYGCTNVGFNREQPLFLNEERYERMMDQVLSGDFSSNLEPL